jgi:DNA polymerase-3 subunit beta
MSTSLQREELLNPLQRVIGVVEKRQTMPILGNVYLHIDDKQLAITASDLEVELQARSSLQKSSSRLEITVAGRKLVDICRALPEQSTLELVVEKDKLLIRCGRSRFSLATLPTKDFPLFNANQTTPGFSIEQKNLRHLTERTAFAMAQQDVRYYLNGMLLEISEGEIKAVATDGHRLALNTLAAPVINNELLQVILPRKGVLELMRLLQDNMDEVAVEINNNHVRIVGKDFTFTSKLIDGRFPEYEKVLPNNGNKIIILEREVLKQALLRASILSNEKFRSIRVQLQPDVLRITANNPELEEAEEEISIDYKQEALEMGFNVAYLLDILNTLESNEVKITFGDATSSILIEEHDSDKNGLFVVMPMLL